MDLLAPSRGVSLTAFSVINTTLSAINFRKGNQFNLKSRAVLGMSLSFQLASHMLKNVPIVLASLGRAPSLSPIKAGSLLAVPAVLHWGVTLFCAPARLTNFQDKLAHVISNPARNADSHKDQGHKSREQTVAFVSVLINTTLTSVLAALLREGDGNLTTLKVSASQEFLK